MISRSTLSHRHTLTGDFVLGGKNKSLLEMYGSTVWHECVSEYVCMCDYIFHTPKRRAFMHNSVHVHIPIAWLLSSYCVASEATNLRDPVIFIFTVQPRTLEPRKGEDTEVKMVEQPDL